PGLMLPAVGAKTDPDYSSRLTRPSADPKSATSTFGYPPATHSRGCGSQTSPAKPPRVSAPRRGGPIRQPRRYASYAALGSWGRALPRPPRRRHNARERDRDPPRKSTAAP